MSIMGDWYCCAGGLKNACKQKEDAKIVKNKRKIKEANFLRE
jgi:hypothetical protein